MNEKLFDLYGESFLKSWIKCSSRNTELIVCYEGGLNKKVIDYTRENIRFIPIDSDKYKKFMKKFGKFNEARGIRFSKSTVGLNCLNYTYNYRFDAIRFSFKIFSYIKCIELSLLNANFAWLDADVVCLKKFESKDFDSIFPENQQLLSYLGRTQYPQPNPYSECGFIGYNLNHPKCMDFIEDMYMQYENGDLFVLKEWHDCMVFDKIRDEYERQNIKFKNLSSNLLAEDHPFMLSELAMFFDHLKGPDRKKIGHS